MNDSHLEAAKAMKTPVSVLDRIPSHWRRMSLSFATSSRCDGPFGSGIKSEHYRDSGVRVIRLQNIKSGYFSDVDSGSAFLDADYVATSLLGHEVIAGDVLIAGLGDQNNLVGRSCTAPSHIEPALVKADCFRFRLLRSMADPQFVALQLSATAVVDSRLLASGSTRSRIPLSQMAQRKIGLPPLSEQKAVVRFVEQEVARINTLIDKQKKLIDLLKEKRQTVIVQAVTKGLDLDVPMKDSGVEWLGKVPAHWKLKHLKHAVMFQRGHDLPSDLREVGSVPVVTSAGVSARHNVAIAKAPGIVTGRYGTIGAFTLVNVDYWPLNTTLYSIDLHGNSVRFLTYLLRSMSHIFLMNSQKSAVPGVDRNDLHRVTTAIPSFVDEQTEIADVLDIRVDQIDIIQKKMDLAISLLQERRSAFITAAVTGALDVTGYQLTTEPAAA